MSGEKREDAIQLRGVLGRVENICVIDAFSCLYTDFVLASIAFSTLAVAASTEVARTQSVGTTTPHSKLLVKKLDALCEVPGAPEKLFTSQQKLRNRSCLRSLSAIDKLRTQKCFSLADVRSPLDCDQYRIADSINIPLHLVKTKEFLKKKSVVPVNEERSTTKANEACGGFKQAGIERVEILNGGLFA